MQAQDICDTCSKPMHEHGSGSGNPCKVRDTSDLSPQLLVLEGWRVEATTLDGKTRRFYVGRSTGWRPCHIEVARRNSTGGIGADRQYSRVTKLYQR